MNEIEKTPLIYSGYLTISECIFKFKTVELLRKIPFTRMVINNQIAYKHFWPNTLSRSLFVRAE